VPGAADRDQAVPLEIGQQGRLRVHQHEHDAVAG
jgi:hypothetical protein